MRAAWRDCCQTLNFSFYFDSNFAQKNSELLNERDAEASFRAEQAVGSCAELEAGWPGRGQGPIRRLRTRKASSPSSFCADAPHSRAQIYNPIPCSSGGSALTPFAQRAESCDVFVPSRLRVIM